MEPAECAAAGKTRRRRRAVVVAVSVSVSVLVLLCVGVAAAVRLRNAATFRDTFIARCEDFEGEDCEKIWGVFEEAYVGRDPCDVPVEAYGPLFAAVPFAAQCNRMMFWSKTKDVVHDFSKKRDCYVTMEDTLLGSVLDHKTWCGKEGSSETFTSGCPGWSQCPNNTVRSFWGRASAAFAEAACGDAVVMLNGTVAAPFRATSVFASIEVPRFRSPRVRSLKVILVTQKNAGTNCEDESLRDLQKELGEGITYDCQEVSEAQVTDCSSHPEKPCGACW
ncbi:ADP-ribosyl cyclase/cyclic ADP-ribose hydrolase 1-like isoform 2-T2 [Spinachia spinachia]